MYANLDRTRNEWFKSYPVFDNQGNLLELPGHKLTGITIFEDKVEEIFNQYKQFLYNSPRSIIKNGSSK